MEQTLVMHGNRILNIYYFFFNYCICVIFESTDIHSQCTEVTRTKVTSQRKF